GCWCGSGQAYEGCHGSA
ncbi:SEC-C metal-binding domain-containing protein, partial [Streptomyces kanamyceticus]